MKDCYLGIDTSNYTTSASLIGVDGVLYANQKKLLSVSAGERGLRQSDALFLHTKNLPEIFEAVKQTISSERLRVIAIGVSTRPRNKEGSYMPCFLAGRTAAYTAAGVTNIPIFEFSHQCGHIAAAIYSSGQMSLFDKEQLGAFHLSGGTTELLLAHPCENGFMTDIVGGTLDLNAGQIIDRIGVKMGLDFPCGPKMEGLASLNSKRIPKAKLSAKDCYFNLSGIENKGTSLYEDSNDASLTAAFVLDFVGRAVVSSSLSFVEKYGAMPMIYAGGVMSNTMIKNMIKTELSKFNPEFYFAEPALSADNAVGIALLAKRAFEKS